MIRKLSSDITAKIPTHFNEKSRHDRPKLFHNLIKTPYQSYFIKKDKTG